MSPMGSGIGTWYNNGAYSGYKWATLYTNMFVYPTGGAYILNGAATLPPDWLYTTALTRAEKSIELVGMHISSNNEKLMIWDWSVTADEVVPKPGYAKNTGYNYKCILSHTASSSNQPPNNTYWQWTSSSATYGTWTSSTNYQERSPAPDGSTGYQQITRFLTDPLFIPYIRQLTDAGGHVRNRIYYANRSEKINDGEPQTRRNTVFLWNFATSTWNVYYSHEYRRNTPVFGGGWGPIIEFDNVTRVVGTDGKSYSCIKSHTSSDTTRPISGSNWITYWRQEGSTTDSWASGKSYYQYKYIKELGYVGNYMNWHDGTLAYGDSMSTSNTEWASPPSHWTLFHRNPNQSYGTGNTTEQ